MARGILVFLIQKQWVAGYSKTNNMPSSVGKKLRCIKPSCLAAGFAATSALILYKPICKSVLGKLCALALVRLVKLRLSAVRNKATSFKMVGRY